MASDGSSRRLLICGALGCRDPADSVVRYKVNHQRTLCDDHAGDRPVIRHV